MEPLRAQLLLITFFLLWTFNPPSKSYSMIPFGRTAFRKIIFLFVTNCVKTSSQTAHNKTNTDSASTCVLESSFSPLPCRFPVPTSETTGLRMRPVRPVVRHSLFVPLALLLVFFFFFFKKNSTCERNLVGTSLLTTSFSIGIIITENPTKLKAQWGLALNLMLWARTRLPGPSLRSPRVSPHRGTGAA